MSWASKRGTPARRRGRDRGRGSREVPRVRARVRGRVDRAGRGSARAAAGSTRAADIGFALVFRAWQRSEVAARCAVIEDRRPLLLADASPEAIRDLGAGRHRVDADLVWLFGERQLGPAPQPRRYRVVDLRRRGGEPWWSRRGRGGASPRVQRWLAESARPGPRGPRALATRSRSSVQTLFAGGADASGVSRPRAGSPRGFRVVLFASASRARNALIPSARAQAGFDRGARPVAARVARGPAARARRARPARAHRSRIVARVPAPRPVAPQARPARDWCALRRLAARRAERLRRLAGLFAGAERVLLSFRNQNPSSCLALRPWLRDTTVARAVGASRLHGQLARRQRRLRGWLGVNGADRGEPHGFARSSSRRPASATRRVVRAELGIAPDARVVCAPVPWSDEKIPTRSSRFAAGSCGGREGRRDRAGWAASARGRSAPTALRARPRAARPRARHAARGGAPARIAARAPDLDSRRPAQTRCSKRSISACPWSRPARAARTEAVRARRRGCSCRRGRRGPHARLPRAARRRERRRRMGEAGRRRVEQHFGLGAFVDATLGRSRGR